MKNTVEINYLNSSDPSIFVTYIKRGKVMFFEDYARLHQGSALSTFLYAIVMDKLTEEIRTESPWDMMFADDIVLCREDRRQLQGVLEVWRNALEKRGLKVSRSKTEYMQASGVDDGGELRLQ